MTQTKKMLNELKYYFESHGESANIKLLRAILSRYNANSKDYIGYVMNQ
jgi:hypothetical protein